MSEEMLISQCAGTMAGLKTGSLFPCLGETEAEILDSLQTFNARLEPKGVRLILLCYKNGRGLLYMYRPADLKRDLQAGLAHSILEARAYPTEDPERCVDCLAGRLRTQKEFPHEVGLFLGYPPEDVDGFIRFGAKGAKCVGTWKVYGDEAAAKRRFALYKKCTEVYGKSYRQFGSFDRLVVQGRRAGGAERA